MLCLEVGSILESARNLVLSAEVDMPSFVLTDAARDLWVDQFTISPVELGITSTHPWSVSKRTLRGGRRDGVDLVRIDNGALSISIAPTRGMGLWRGQYLGDPIGWRSPVEDGPVNPAHVNLMNWGGLGWLEGFDELMARCGLENNGAPYHEQVADPDGNHRHVTYSLHGKIANIPAHYVAVHVSGDEITVEGRVDEAKLFGPRIRMISKISTKPGSNAITVRDEFVNLGDSPADFQVLYHYNFGPPYLGEGSRLVAPVKTVVPRDSRAGEGLGHYDVYGGPEPGFVEQCYFFEFVGDGPKGKTLAMLRDAAGTRGAVVRFHTSELPYFTQWKSTRGLKEGYVTGLEPGTNYPNPKPYEKSHKRVVPLAPGGSYVVETALEALGDAASVAKIEAEIRSLQSKVTPNVLAKPAEPYTPAS